MFETARVEAAVRRLDGEQALGLAGLAAVGALIVLGSVVSPRMMLLVTVGAALLVFFVTHVDWAILLVVASAPLEGAFASGPAGISVTKLAGGLCIAAFLFALVKDRRPIVFERGQALVLGLLGIALLSTAWAEQSSAAITTTTRYASFAAIYVIITQFGADRVLQRRIAWTLTITCSIAAALGLNEYLNGSAQLATLKYAQQNDFAFILATSLPFMFFLLGRTTTAAAGLARRDRARLGGDPAQPLARRARRARRRVRALRADRPAAAAGDAHRRAVAAVGTLFVDPQQPAALPRSRWCSSSRSPSRTSRLASAPGAPPPGSRPTIRCWASGPGTSSSTTTPSPASRSGRSR